jgi:hypothetical protein
VWGGSCSSPVYCCEMFVKVNLLNMTPVIVTNFITSLTYLLTYLLTFLLHGAGYYLKSSLSLSLSKNILLSYGT